MGQYLQQGTRNFFETTLIVNKPKSDMVIKVTDNDDKLKYLNNKSLDFINKKAFEGTIAAHTKIGKVDNFIIEIDNNDEYHFGYLFM
jgi:glucose-6-phosphate isomerase